MAKVPDDDVSSQPQQTSAVASHTTAPDLVFRDILTTEEKTNMYMWTIDNFSSCNEKIESPTFSTTKNDDLKWCIEVYPNGIDESVQEYLSISIRLVSCKQSGVSGKVDLWILNANGVMKNIDQVSVREFKNEQAELWNCARFIKRNDLPSLPGDKLTICCIISLMTKLCRRSVEDEGCKLSQNMKIMDLTLVADEMEIEADRTTLVDRNAVFAAKLKRDEETHRLQITDIDYTILVLMLIYIYTNRAPNLDNMAGRLLAATNKYAISDLKDKCEKTLHMNLCVETAADTLLHAELHSATWLKAQTIEFIATHSTEVLETAGWRNLVSVQRHLVAEVLCAFSDVEITKM